MTEAALEAESTILLEQLLRENGDDLKEAFMELCRRVPHCAVETPEFQRAIATEMLSITLSQVPGLLGPVAGRQA